MLIACPDIELDSKLQLFIPGRVELLGAVLGHATDLLLLRSFEPAAQGHANSVADAGDGTEAESDDATKCIDGTCDHVGGLLMDLCCPRIRAMCGWITMHQLEATTVQQVIEDLERKGSKSHESSSDSDDSADEGSKKGSRKRESSGDAGEQQNGHAPVKQALAQASGSAVVEGAEDANLDVAATERATATLEVLPTGRQTSTSSTSAANATKAICNASPNSTQPSTRAFPLIQQGKFRSLAYQSSHRLQIVDPVGNQDLILPTGSSS